MMMTTCLILWMPASEGEGGAGFGPVVSEQAMVRRRTAAPARDRTGYRADMRAYRIGTWLSRWWIPSWPHQDGRAAPAEDAAGGRVVAGGSGGLSDERENGVVDSTEGKARHL